MIDVVIHVEGGMVQAVYSNNEEVRVDVVDMDNVAEDNGDCEAAEAILKMVENEPNWKQVY